LTKDGKYEPMVNAFCNGQRNTRWAASIEDKRVVKCKLPFRPEYLAKTDYFGDIRLSYDEDIKQDF
jgi:hypothetical protein